MVLTHIAWAAIVTSASMVSYDLQVKNVAYSSTLRGLTALIGTGVCCKQYIMRRILTVLSVIFYAFICFAQKDVTKFMGLPVDGTKSEMIKNLKSKGFKLLKFGDKEVLSGSFNGNDVNVFIATENGKVSRIMVCDANKVNEADIKIRFNRLCNQFEGNGKYYSLGDYPIPENEDISYEMTVNNKRYKAIFYQLSEGETIEEWRSSIISEVLSKYTDEQWVSPSDEVRRELIASALENRISTIKNKPVWFMISEFYGEYYISMFYDNEYNRANGEDL